MLLLGSSLQLPLPVTMTPSPSDVLLLETVSESPSGEWAVGAVSVHCYTVQQVPLVLVGLAVLSLLQLGLGLEQQVLHPSHQR